MKRHVFQMYLFKLTLMTPAFSFGMTQMPDEASNKNLLAYIEERIELRKICQDDQKKIDSLTNRTEVREGQHIFKSIEAGDKVLEKIETESIRYDKAKGFIQEIVDKEEISKKDIENYYFLNARLPCSNSLRNWKRLFNTAHKYPEFKPQVQKSFQSSVVENPSAGPSGLATMIELVLLKNASQNGIIKISSDAAFDLMSIQRNMKHRLKHFTEEFSKVSYIIKIPGTKKIYTFYNNEAMGDLLKAEWAFSKHYRERLDRWKQKYL